MFLSRDRRHSAAAIIRIVALACTACSQAGWAKEDWQPISAEELALKTVPGFPGEHAVILWREEATNDQKGETRHHYRIKILDDEGRKSADIEIPYSKRWKVDEITARLIRPDGSIVDFEGTIYDKTVVKGRGIRLSVKSFTVPEAQPGSIVEYRFRRRWSEQYMPTVWEIQDKFFVRHVHFSLKPADGAPLQYTTYNLADKYMPEQHKGVLEMQLENVPAFAEEEFMPPAITVKSRVEFFYQPPFITWPLLGESVADELDKFVGKPKKLAELAAQIAPPSETPEQRLRKLYARAQEIRNLSFEPERTRNGTKQENLKENANAEDVLKRGYGNGNDINLAFLALARAAGFEAAKVYLVTRTSGWFDPKIISFARFNASVIQVRAGDKLYYLDPATRFCPFGLLPWEETASAGVRVSSGSLGLGVAETPLPVSEDAIVERTGILDLSPDGAVQGHIQVVFHGQEALQRRLSALELEDAARVKSLEEEIRKWFPPGASVKLDRVTGWNASEEPLAADVSVRTPEFASATGRRLLLTAMLSRSYRKDAFAHAARTQPIYFAYPYQEKDHLQVRLCQSHEVESLPQPQKMDAGFARYEMSAKAEGGTLILDRNVVVDHYFLKPSAYPAIRTFMANMRSGDDQQIVLQAHR